MSKAIVSKGVYGNRDRRQVCGAIPLAVPFARLKQVSWVSHTPIGLRLERASLEF
ncbi:hypothetical protein ACN4EG_24425 [Alkalinema pantanalense CENA528]|uniref:hypothetical protein n=1 Tax=Alkalinema pantanalense TaxID=1620705 RepID=UPI003D6EFE73